MARLGVWRWWSPRYSRTIRRAGDASDARRSLRSRRVYLCPEVERACVDVLAVWLGDPRAVDDVHGCASGHQTQCFQLVAEKRCWRVFRSRPASSERQPCAPDLPCLAFPDVGVAARYGVGVGRTARGPTQRPALSMAVAGRARSFRRLRGLKPSSFAICTSAAESRQRRAASVHSLSIPSFFSAIDEALPRLKQKRPACLGWMDRGCRHQCTPVTHSYRTR
jgi:hypothetical protein